MFSPDPVRPSQVVSQQKPENTFNDIALAMFPSMVDQLLEPQSTSLELPNTSATSSRDRVSRTFPQT